MKMMRVAGAFLAGVLAAGCATVESGKAFDTSAEARLKIGVTTMAEAQAWFGNPTQVLHHSSGETGLVYVHLKSHANGLTGKAQASSETLAMEFGADGRLERFSTGGTPATVR
jgi:hypothetical protein